jgi:hypothetical protein
MQNTKHRKGVQDRFCLNILFYAVAWLMFYAVVYYTLTHIATLIFKHPSILHQITHTQSQMLIFGTQVFLLPLSFALFYYSIGGDVPHL